MDFLLPKHYFFHRGFDGFVGTVYRYSQTMLEWNPVSAWRTPSTSSRLCSASSCP